MIKDKTAKHPIIISDFTSTDCIYPARHKLTGAAYIQNNGFAGCGISLYFIYLLVTTTNKIKQETSPNQNAKLPIFVFSKIGAETLETTIPT